MQISMTERYEYTVEYIHRVKKASVFMLKLSIDNFQLFDHILQRYSVVSPYLIAYLTVNISYHTSLFVHTIHKQKTQCWPTRFVHTFKKTRLASLEPVQEKEKNAANRHEWYKHKHNNSIFAPSLLDGTFKMGNDNVFFQL